MEIGDFMNSMNSWEALLKTKDIMAIILEKSSPIDEHNYRFNVKIVSDSLKKIAEDNSFINDLKINNYLYNIQKVSIEDFDLSKTLNMVYKNSKSIVCSYKNNHTKQLIHNIFIKISKDQIIGIIFDDNSNRQLSSSNYIGEKVLLDALNSSLTKIAI